MNFIDLGFGVSVNQTGLSEEDVSKIFSPGMVRVLAKCVHLLNEEREDLLLYRKKRQAHYDSGEVPVYLNQESDAVRGAWKINPLPEDLLTRRVEITGPVHSRKMVIQMLSRNQFNERADMAMLDFEDSMKPVWQNVIQGVHNAIGAIKQSLTFTHGNKSYTLNPHDMAEVMIRVRGLHLLESNVRFNNQPISAGLFDLVSCFFHTFKTIRTQGKSAKYYIPKCEHYLEARWWNRLFSVLENEFELKTGFLRATFLIETLPAAYQMEEILYEIKDHAAGFNGGRWDKIFSDIKTLKKHPNRVLADRSTIDMNKSWMDHYAKRLIKICHSRGAFAIGGMSAFTPGKDKHVRDEQTQKVIADKTHEAEIGHDGCWVSHPYFVGFAKQAFKTQNQLNAVLDDFSRTPELLPLSEKPKSLEGLRKNIRVGIAYQEGWNSGLGCISWDNLMEDLATFEISRAQVWQWRHHHISLETGEVVNEHLIKNIFAEELETILNELEKRLDKEVFVDKKGSFTNAKKLAMNLFLEEELREFLTLESEIETLESTLI